MNEQKASHHRTVAIAVFMVLTVILLGEIERAEAQWTNGTDIYNTNSGNVGIGTTSPMYGLHIEKTNGSGGTGWAALFKETGKNGVLIGSRGSGNGIGTISGVLFDLSNISHLSLNPFGGNVGIGTLAPGNTLELFGANPILKLNNGSDSYQFGFNGFTSATGGHPVLYNTKFTNTNSIFKISGRGTGASLGGGSFLGGMLQLFGTDYVADSTNFGSSLSLNTITGAPISEIPVGINFNSQSGGTGVLGAFSFSMNSAVAMTIGTNGSVGIGITGPGYKLDVQGGQVNASGGLCIAGDCKTAWSQVGGSGGSVNSVFGRTGAVVAATNDYTWAQINKSTSSLADLTTRSAGDLSSGTLPDARFPSTLPAVSGTNLTALNASNINSGTLDNARLSIVPTNKGGTGLTVVGPSGNFLRSNGSTFTSSALQASDLPPSSTNYIQNQTTGPQNGGFNISGNGTVGGTLAGNIVNATAQFNIANTRILSVPGTDNTFLGNGPGSSNSIGTGNSFFGKDAGRNNTTGNDNSFFAGDAGFANISGINNSFFGSAAGNSNTSGSNNTFYGYRAGLTNMTGSHNTIIGAFAGVGTNGLSFATAIGSYAQVSASDTIVLGKTQGTYSGVFRLADTVIVRGWLQLDALSTAGGNSLCWNNAHQVSQCSSSLRYKKNIAPFSTGLTLVQRLNPIHFQWKDGGMQDIGFGAEDVAEVEPLLVTHNAKGEVEGVKYDRISAVLVNAVKEQQAQIGAQQIQLEQQQAELSAQQQQIKQQQSLIDGLKKLFCEKTPSATVCQ